MKEAKFTLTMPLDLLKRMAKKVIPIAKITYQEGPYIDPSEQLTLEEGDVHIIWHVQILNRDLNWELGAVSTKIESKDRDEYKMVHLKLNLVKQAYLKHRDQVSHIDNFREEYRFMLGQLYGDPTRVQNLHNHMQIYKALQEM